MRHPIRTEPCPVCAGNAVKGCAWCDGTGYVTPDELIEASAILAEHPSFETTPGDGHER